MEQLTREQLIFKIDETQTPEIIIIYNNVVNSLLQYIYIYIYIYSNL